VNIMPVLPGITDGPAMLDDLVRGAADAGVKRVGVCALRLQHEARKRYLPFIAEEFPHLAARYEAAYAHSTDVSKRYREGLSRYVHGLCRKYGLSASERAEDEVEDDAPPAPDPQLAFPL
jgi:DNA repair photolyase